MTTVAVVFVPDAKVVPYAKLCLDYCARRGYDIAGVIRGDWPAVAAMLATKAVGVVVVARREHLEPDREPRVEVLAEVAAQSRPILARNRRPRLNQQGQAVNRLRARRLGDRDI